MTMHQEKAIIAAGCFWGVEHKFRQVPGVMDTRVGYIGGRTENPTYEDVCRKDTGHAEAVEILFNPDQISYEDILRVFFNLHDPTQKDRQGPDIGDQYRSAIFTLGIGQKQRAEALREDLQASGTYKKPIATRITPADHLIFYEAEEYHQCYIEKQRR